MMSIRAMSLVWEHFPRGGSEKLVALALADWCDDDGRSLHPSMRAVAKKCVLSEAQARRIVHQLIDDGFLEVVGNEHGGAPGATRQYRLRLDRLTANTDATPGMDARANARARDGLHGCARRLAPMQAKPPLTINNHQREAIASVVDGAAAPIADLLGDSEIEKVTAQAGEHDMPTLRCPTEQIVEAYHALMPDNPRVKVLSDARRKTIGARWRQASRLTCKPFGYRTVDAGVAAWRAFFGVCAQSDFLTGRAKSQPGKPPFVADIDFLMSPSGFAKCLENKYHREVV